MIQQLIYLTIGLTLNLNAGAVIHYKETNPDSTFTDGPYIFFKNNELTAKWIEDNSLKERFITHDSFEDLKKQFSLNCSYSQLHGAMYLKPRFRQYYNKVDSIAVISDIHGEYNSYINLLKVNGIIRDDLSWNFGKGHLVILGDVFDRGDKVTELLWHIFCLEKQAEKAGGMVHMLLGNHELMVLGRDMGYINDKYEKVQNISQTYYFDLYSDSTILGKWLRSKPVMMTINDIIFIHAGISMDMMNKKLDVSEVNRKFSKTLFGRDFGIAFNDDLLNFLNDSDGPIWYRGYFTDPAFCETKIDSILNFYGKKHIIVGHTPHEGVVSLYNTKILGSDSGIGNKRPGEIIIIKNGVIYKSCSRGIRVKL